MRPRLISATHIRTPSRRTVALLGSLSIVLLLLACGGADMASSDGTPVAPDALSASVPRWVCPSATPLPPIQVEDGTQDNGMGTPVPKYRDTEPYEREYGVGQLPPPRPTPYGKGAGFQSQTAFFIGQIVNWPSVDVQVSVASARTTGASPDGRDTLGPDDAIYTLQVKWKNRGPSFPFEPARRLAITGITKGDGRLTGGTWQYSNRAAIFAQFDTARAQRVDIPAGESIVQMPIIAPAGSVASIDLLLEAPGSTASGDLRLHFTKGRAPDCSFDGTWDAAYSRAPREFSGVAAPPGADVIVATALRYVGRQYCWGGKGYTPCSGLGVTPPCADYPCFDCSGLTWFSYKENGWPLGQGTENQKKYQAVPAAEIQPGDLMLFSAINAQNSGARITHVGLYAGDLDGDGTGDMIHAANYPAGVIISKNVLNNPYYRSHLVVVTRPPRGGGL